MGLLTAIDTRGVIVTSKGSGETFASSENGGSAGGTSWHDYAGFGRTASTVYFRGTATDSEQETPLIPDTFTSTGQPIRSSLLW